MRKKIVLISIAAILSLAAIGGGTYYFVTRNDDPTKQPARPENTVDYGPAKPEDSAGIESSKDKEATKDETKPEENKPSNQSSPTQASSVRVTITQASQSGSQVLIRALVEGATSGTCNLTLTKDGQTITKSAAVGVQANYAICQGFNIPVSDFPSGGNWTTSITATVNGATSPAAEKGVQVTK